MKRGLLVEADGGPLAVVIAGVNVADIKLLAGTLEAIGLRVPNRQASNRSICAWTKATVIPRAIRPPSNITIERTFGASANRSASPREAPRHPARRWVVERALA